jgi:hypothetical protein
MMSLSTESSRMLASVSVLMDALNMAGLLAHQLLAVPGRKTELTDAMWIADLAAHGLIKASFVPDAEIQELRALTRTRKQLVREQTRHVQRIHQDADRSQHSAGFGAQRHHGGERPTHDRGDDRKAVRVSRANRRLSRVAGSRRRRRNCTTRCMGG